MDPLESDAQFELILSAPWSEFPNGVTTVSNALQPIVRCRTSKHESSSSSSSPARTVYLELQSLWRLFKDLRSKSSALYRTVSGGRRAWVDLIAVLLAKCSHRKVYLHHHSMAYFRSNSIHHSWLRYLTVEMHFCLDHSMASRLAESYGVETDSILVVPNVFAVPPPKNNDVRVFRVSNAPLRIGHMSNLAPQKGVSVLMKLASGAEEDITVLLAGPTGYSEQRRADSLPNVEHVGALDGPESKAHFFDSIDVFAFLSTYEFEAQPLVVYEALAHGVPVVAFDWAGLKDQLESAYGGVVLPCNSSLMEIRKSLEDAAKRDRARIASSYETFYLGKSDRAVQDVNKALTAGRRMT